MSEHQLAHPNIAPLKNAFIDPVSAESVVRLGDFEGLGDNAQQVIERLQDDAGAAPD